MYSSPSVVTPTQRPSPFILLQGLQALRCPHGLAFNLEQQTCDWKANVKNCDRKEKTKVVKPLFNTVEPLCQVIQRGFIFIFTSVTIIIDILISETFFYIFV